MTWGAPVGKFNGEGIDFVQLIEASKPKTYIHDLCVRCGKVVDRTKGAST